MNGKRSAFGSAIRAICVVTMLVPAVPAFAHPGSGIVVDRRGNVYFIDTGSGVYRIDRKGTLTRLSGPVYHWLAIDTTGRLAGVTLPRFAAGDAIVARAGTNEGLMVSSDFALTVGTDGALYYPWRDKDGRVRVHRLANHDSTTVLATLPERTALGPLRWVNGLAAGADGKIYYTEDRAVRSISPRGEVSTVIEDPPIGGSASIPGVEGLVGPYLRGLAVTDDGTVYVAAAGRGAVVKITPDRKVSTILTSTSPWSPTAVAVAGKELYVLEYLHTDSDNRREWLPRVRKISADGTVTTVASIDHR